MNALPFFVGYDDSATIKRLKYFRTAEVGCPYKALSSRGGYTPYMSCEKISQKSA